MTWVESEQKLNAVLFPDIKLNHPHRNRNHEGPSEPIRDRRFRSCLLSIATSAVPSWCQKVPIWGVFL